MRVYGEDELNRPSEVIPFAKQYIQIDPASPIGHITLARALLARRLDDDGQPVGLTHRAVEDVLDVAAPLLDRYGRRFGLDL